MKQEHIKRIQMVIARQLKMKTVAQNLCDQLAIDDAFAQIDPFLAPKNHPQRVQRNPFTQNVGVRRKVSRQVLSDRHTML